MIVRVRRTVETAGGRVLATLSWPRIGRKPFIHCWPLGVQCVVNAAVIQRVVERDARSWSP